MNDENLSSITFKIIDDKRYIAMLEKGKIDDMNKQDFLSLIEANENLAVKDLQKCRENGCKTYIYGAGYGAEAIVKRLGKYMNFAGKLVDRSYYNGGEGVYILEDILTNEKINIVIGRSGNFKDNLKPYENNIGILVDRDAFMGTEGAIFDRAYLEANADNLLNAYESLCDDMSRKHFIAYVNQRISMDYKYLKDLYIPQGQYFEKGIIEFTDGECFADCGAYIGDTAEEFAKYVKAAGINYKAIHSFEPDAKNFLKLEEKKSKIQGLYCYNLATGDRTEELYFNSTRNSSSSVSSENKGVKIKSDKLDNILKDESITFIKMDIEGYELKALKGAENIIKERKPKLAICIYHKKEDLWEIWEYLKSLVPEYKFYVRAYAPSATELVLYAVTPKN